MKTDDFHPARFLDAQKNSYDVALRELQSGKKRSHWIWYIFPQIKGLGLSTNSEIYGLLGLSEARAYFAHPVLGQRLREAVNAMLAHRSLSAASILGEIDALKFRSCLTLFAYANPSDQIFDKALKQFFDGERDLMTIDLLKTRGEV